ncbi:MAG: UbiA family prenyltransferase [Phycisphaerales bacterium]|nr:UbiA family prenyltransferase [Phycisphaerales bacterium]
MIRSLAHLAHLALFAAVYVAAAVVCAAQLSGAQAALTPGVLLYAWSTALLAYLLDRVKLRDAWLDPADRAAHPARFAFLFAHRRAARLLMAGAGVLSLVSGWMLHPATPIPIAAAGTVVTIAGVLLYAGRPRPLHGGPRVKDRFVVKNLFVGAGVAGFAVLVVGLAAARPGGAGGNDAATASDLISRLPRPPLLLVLVFVYLTLRIYADAVLCDIDDEVSDRVHGTRTLPTRFGGDRAWDIAMWLRLALAASLLCWPVGPFAARAAWAGFSAAGTIALRWWRPAKIRDLVDARFGVEAACVWTVTLLA